ncbi:MAG: DUF2784 domain-containing protein [Pseudomonadota bacterium]
MMASWLADAVLLLHLLFIVFAVAGGLLALRWHWTPWLHLPALAWGATVEFTGWICPLTPLENALRQAGGAAAYAESFIERYLLPLIYPGALTRELQFLLGGALLLINVVVYAIVWHRHRRRTPA